MNKVFTENGWADYTFWETEDRKTLKKINKLIEDICRNGNEGIGKPEAVEILLGIGAGALTIRIGLSIKLMKIMFLYWLVDIITVISKKFN